MRLSSPNFANNHNIPADYTADGLNICPDFFIEGVPLNAHSLVILCHDPDATIGVPWIHWFAWGLPVATSKITAGKLPEGSINGLNSFGDFGYGGPSPTPGTGPHRYVFALYALKQEVDLNGLDSYQDITTKLREYIIGEASWTGVYERI